MTPLEKAVEAYDNTTLGTAEAHVRRIITAFLEAAAGDVVLCERIGDAAYVNADVSLTLSGRDALLKLKEAVNAS